MVADQQKRCCAPSAISAFFSCRRSASRSTSKNKDTATLAKSQIRFLRTGELFLGKVISLVACTTGHGWRLCILEHPDEEGGESMCMQKCEGKLHNKDKRETDQDRRPHPAIGLPHTSQSSKAA